MKKCYKCNQKKPLECFSKNSYRKDGLSSQCKECHRHLRRQHYERNKDKILIQVGKKKDEYHQWFYSLKTGPCKDCGKTYPHYCMDFDHLRDKEFNLSQCLRYRWGKKKVLNEIQKCELICAICHRIRTYKRTHDV